MEVEYQIEDDLPALEFVNLLKRSTLAERRPIDEPSTIEVMIREADIMVTARVSGKLVGVSRAITDRAYCTYLSDLAVDTEFQRKGIGRELIQRTHREAGLTTTLILLSAPKARDYYPHIGMTSHDSCWITPRIAKNNRENNASQVDSGQVSLDALDTNQLGEFFDKLATEYDAAIKRCVPRYDEMQATMVGYLPEYNQPPRILELGAGTGALTHKVANRFPGSDICTVDLSTQSLDICARRVGEIATTEKLVADMRSLDFADESFDIIVSSIAIHHLTSPEKQGLFSNCYKWLRPGGIISYCDQFGAPTPEVYNANLDHWHRIALSKGATEQEWLAWMEHQEQHDYHDTLSDQMDWLKQSGFSSIDCQWRNLLWTVLTARKTTS